MTLKKIIKSEKLIKNCSKKEIAKIAHEALYPEKKIKESLSVRDVSGNSGAKTYICHEDNNPKCIIKISDGKGIMNSHPNTNLRVKAATEIMREHGIAPPILMVGADFHIEQSAGISVMKDFFHFDTKLAPLKKIAELLARIHSAPTSWYGPLREKFLTRDMILEGILRPMPHHAPCWCLPWSAFDTGMPVLGVGNPNTKIAKEILELSLKTGVYKRVMQCSAFFPQTSAAKRQVVIHNDFKPDNVLYEPETGFLTAIDYDLVQVGAAIMDFGLPYTMWLGSRYTSYHTRKIFIETYLKASNLPHSNKDVKEMMLDCEVNTIVAFPGLLANIYDAEIPLLRGTRHPTAKEGFYAGGPDDIPTGPELVDLLAEAIQIIRSDKKLIDECLKDGLVMTIFKREGLGIKHLDSWIKEMQKNRMLRLFGIAEKDGSDLYVASHAR